MKRVLSLLLVLAMVISMVPNVFATTGDSSDTDFGGMLDGYVSSDDLAYLTVSLEEGSEGEKFVWLAEAAGTLTLYMESYTEGSNADLLVSTDGLNYELFLSESEDGSLVVDVVEGQEIYIWVLDYDGQAVELAIMGNYLPPLGSSGNPIWLYDWTTSEDGSEMTVTVNVPVGTYYYAAYITGMNLTINDVAFNDVSMFGRGATLFYIENNGDAAADYVLKAVYPTGSSSNPVAITEMGTLTASLLAGNWGDGVYYYKWIAEDKGILSASNVVAPEGSNYCAVTLYNYNTYINRNTDESEDGTVSVEVNAGDVVEVSIACDIQGDVSFDLAYELVPGAKGYPIELYDVTFNEDHTEGSVTVEVPVGKYYYCVYGMNGMNITINDVAFTETEMFGRGGTLVYIDNTGDAAAEYTIKGVYPIGSSSRPAALSELGEMSGSLVSGGYYYTWIAEDKGILTASDIVAPAGVAYADVVLYNLNTYVYMTSTESTDGTVSVEVNAGDEVQISIQCGNSDWSIPTGDFSFNLSFELVPGAKGYPIELYDVVFNEDYTEGSVTVEVPVGKYYYCVYGMNGMNITINDVAFTETEMFGRGGTLVYIDNTGDAAAEYTIKGVYPIGSSSRPAALSELGEMSGSLVSGGYYYTWTATKNGVLTASDIVAPAGVAYADVVLYNLNTYVYMTSTESTDGTVSVEVNAGDEVQISIQCGNSDWSTPTGDFSFNLSFEESIVASIGDVLYSSLQDAVNVGGTIELLADVATDKAIEVSKAVVLNLNGHTVATTENDTVGDGVFHVVAGGDLTINGEGTINGLGGNPYSMAIWADGGKVTINGGYYTNLGASDPDDSDHFDLIYVKNGGEVVINGGKFECETPAWVLNSHDTKKGTITVYGGEFVGFNPADNNCEKPKVSFVAEGYHSVEADGIYTVGEHTVVTDAAVDATCTATGLTEGSHCSVCNKVIVAQEEVAMLEHAWDEGVYTNPTTEANGYTTYTCGSCGETKVDIDEGSQITFGFTKQPVSISETVTEGDVITFSVEATGAAKYLWQKSTSGTGNWGNLDEGDTYSGIDTPTLTVNAVGENDLYFSCVIYNADGKTIRSSSVTYRSELAFKILSHTTTEKQMVYPKRVIEFSVTARGYGITYSWQRSRNGSTNWGYLSSIPDVYTISEDGHKVSFRADPEDEWYYRCVVYDENNDKIIVGNFTYDTYPAAQVTNQTTEIVSVDPGTEVTFFVETDKDTTENLQYTWLRSKRSTGSWQAASDGVVSEDGRSFTVSSIPNNPWYYICLITDEYGNKTKTTAMTYECESLLVFDSWTTEQPQVVAGQTVTFFVTVPEEAQEGTTYQWFRSKSSDGGWATVNGQNSSTLNLKAVANNAYYYMCKARDKYGISIKSAAMTYTAVEGMTMVNQSEATQVVAAGDTVNFFVDVNAAAGQDMTYNWYKSSNPTSNWRNVSDGDADDTQLTLTAVAGNALYYRCVITDAYGNVLKSISFTYTAE